MVRLPAFVKILDDRRGEQTRTFTMGQFCAIVHATNLMAVHEFWLALQRLVEPDAEISLHAEGVLREMARFSLETCAGAAVSPEHAAVLEDFGFPESGEC
jgi:hypothetical protein